MNWHPSLADHTPLQAFRLGLRRDELRLFLRLADAEGSRRHVIQFEQVASFYNTLHFGHDIRISDQFPHGSFGWWLPAGEECHSVQIVGRHGGAGSLLVLARRVTYRLAGPPEWGNWPG